MSWGQMRGPLGTDCGYSHTHAWYDACEGALLIGVMIGVLLLAAMLVAFVFATRRTR